MSARHAAALALVGWYLLSPPLDHSTGQVVQKSSLRNWGTVGTFATFAKCQAKRQEEITSFADVRNQLSPAEDEYYEHQYDVMTKWPLGTSRKSRGLGLKAAMASACVASDDPRLKSK